MIKDVAVSVERALSRFFLNWRYLGMFLGLYLVLLGAFYIWLHTGDSAVSLALIALLTIIEIAIFFLLQSLGVSYMEGEKVSALLKRALGGFWKLIVISIPFVLLAWLFIFLFDKIKLPAPAPTPRPIGISGSHSGSGQSDLPGTALLILRYLVLYFVLPLALIHMWIATAREGLLGAIKHAARVLLRAFAPRSVLIYTIGLLLFGVIPYFLTFTRTPSKSFWLEMGLNGAKLVLAGLFALAGWIVTLGALSRNSAGPGPAAEAGSMAK